MIATLTLAGVWNWLLNNGPAAYSLAVVVVASLVNGLTAYPDLETPLGKIQHLLGLLSFVVHSDSPGTFKLPFTHSAEPLPVPGTVKPLAPPKGFVDREVLGMGVAWCLLMGAAVVLLGNCAWFQKSVGPAIVACSEQEIAQSAIADVTTVLTAATPGTEWQAELASVAAKFGEDVVGCIVQKLLTGWTKPGNSLPPAAVRAQQWLSSQPKQFKL